MRDRTNSANCTKDGEDLQNGRFCDDDDGVGGDDDCVDSIRERPKRKRQQSPLHQRQRMSSVARLLDTLNSTERTDQRPVSLPFSCAIH